MPLTTTRATTTQAETPSDRRQGFCFLGREYARVVGKSHQYFTQCNQAAKVATQVAGLDVAELLHRAKHLAAIHKAPADDWQW